MNPKWMKSKGVLGAVALMLSAVAMAGDNIFGDTRTHDWNAIIATFATGLMGLGIRVKQGPPEAPK